MPCLISVVLDTEDMVLLVLGLRICVSVVVVAACILLMIPMRLFIGIGRETVGEMGRGATLYHG